MTGVSYPVLQRYVQDRRPRAATRMPECGELSLALAIFISFQYTT